MMECDNLFVWLWKVIAAAVMSDPTTYTEAILGKRNQEYVEWISKPDKWGGKSLSFVMVDDAHGKSVMVDVGYLFEHGALVTKSLNFFVGASLGAIELAILSDFYGREIAAYDIQTKRCDVYGQVWDRVRREHQLV